MGCVRFQIGKDRELLALLATMLLRAAYKVLCWGAKLIQERDRYPRK